MAEFLNISKRGALGILCLARPSALNALNQAMIDGMLAALTHWDERAEVQRILICGEGRKAFCSGGDVKALASLGLGQNDTVKQHYFRSEYRLDYHLATCKQSTLALMGGLTMGGGAGLAIFADQRLVHENSTFAMPEVAIGLYPDVAASYFLSRLKGFAGRYLGMTGARIGVRDMLDLGLANVYIPKDKWEMVTRQAREGDWTFQKYDHDSLPKGIIGKNYEAIEYCFSADSVNDIYTRLKQAGDFGKETLALLRTRCALSQKVAFEAQKRGQTMSLEEVFEMENRLSHAFIKEPDFYEGVRAVLIDKDNKPQWRYADLKDVTPAKVESMFTQPCPALGF